MATALKIRRQPATLAPETGSWHGLATGVYTLWLKHMRKFWKNGMELGGTLATPILWMLLFGVCMEGVMRDLEKNTIGMGYKVFITPGVMLMTGLTAAILGGTTLLIERVNGVIKEYLVAPIPRLAVLLGTMASGLTKALLQAALVLAAGFLLDRSLVASAGAVLAAMLVVAVFSLGFVGLAAAFASQSKSMESYHSIIMVMNLPVLFLSNALYPLDKMPNIIKVGALLNPTTYGVDAVRIILYNARPEIGLWIDIPVLLAFMVFGLWYGYRWFNRSVANVAA